MPAVKLGGLAARWLLAGALCASCLHVDDISLGALQQDAGSEREPPDVGTPGPTPPPAMIVAPDAGRAGDPREEMEHEDEEPRTLTRDAGSPLDDAADASALDAGTDARPLDAGVDGGAEAGGADAGGDAALAADGGPLDASSDAQRSLLCTLEPWHCL
jgi:hypothetical protein